jgi:hypothetical protein
MSSVSECKLSWKRHFESDCSQFYVLFSLDFLFLFCGVTTQNLLTLIISDTKKFTFIYICIYITLFHNTAIPDMFRRQSRRRHQELYLGLHTKFICFVVGLNNISRTHYQENGCSNVVKKCYIYTKVHLLV